MNFVVELPRTAEADLERLFDFLLDQADTSEDLDRAQAAIDAIRATAQHRLAITPFSFRKAAQNPAQRELIIPFGRTGYVALYEIVSTAKVIVGVGVGVGVNGCGTPARGLAILLAQIVFYALVEPTQFAGEQGAAQL